METELPPRQDLDRLGESADAAGQNRKRVGALGHRPLALVHVGHHDQLTEAGMRDFAVLQMDWDDPGYPAATGQYRVGDAAHQSVAPAAIDELDARCSKQRAELVRRSAIPRIIAGGRAAVDAELLDLAQHARASLSAE